MRKPLFPAKSRTSVRQAGGRKEPNSTLTSDILKKTAGEIKNTSSDEQAHALSVNKTTTHRIIEGPAQNLARIKPESIHLVVTSPPYPMIKMWDEIFATQNQEIGEAIGQENGALSFELMHTELDKVWEQIYNVLVPGGIACINIGDATRTMKGIFTLYPNHARIISAFIKLGFINLPNIIWRKQTNAPNKFMGSGMLPPNAYVTLEHEWILVFRKGDKRAFTLEEEKSLRKESAFFWEERNSWFSDLWDIKGTRQSLPDINARDKSAAFPFIIPYRLINMFSIKGDTVLDPFLGTGTTSLAAISSERNSIGIEIDSSFSDMARERVEKLDTTMLNDFIERRINQHKDFFAAASTKGRQFKHVNKAHECKVTTSQETEIRFCGITGMKHANSIYKAFISRAPLMSI